MTLAHGGAVPLWALRAAGVHPLHPSPRHRAGVIRSPCPNKFPFSHQAAHVEHQDGQLEAVLFLKVSLLHVPFIYARSPFDFPSGTQ